MATSLRLRAPARISSPTTRSERLEILIEERSEDILVRLGGHAGFRQAEQLSAALLGLSAMKPRSVALDLSDLTSISSLAMGALVSFYRGLARAQGRMCLAGALQESVRADLERIDFLALFEPDDRYEVQAAPPVIVSLVAVAAIPLPMS
jgi:anti-anti-sigma factor